MKVKVMYNFLGDIEEKIIPVSDNYCMEDIWIYLFNNTEIERDDYENDYVHIIDVEELNT